MNHVRYIALTLVLASAAPARADDWLSAGFDALHQRVTTERVGSGFEPGWSLTLASPYAISSPAAADGVLVMGARDGVVRAFAAGTGKLLWQFATGDTVQASPAIKDGRVFVSSLDGKLYALHLADGTLAWQRELGGLEYASPTVVGDSLLVPHGFPGRTLLKLDAKTGDTLWETSPDLLMQFSNSSPVSDGAQVFMAVNEGQLHSFDFATGNHLWSYQTDGIVNATGPLLANGRVYLFPGGASGKLHAVDAATGRSAAGWPVDVPAAEIDVTGTRIDRDFATSSLTINGSLLTFDLRVDDAVDGDGDGAVDQYLLRESVVAMSPTDGHLIWQSANGRKLIASANDLPSFWLCPT
ncbi:MAG TPA: PQQ-binding-like beta-propeller repeat protein, partial [Polyangia bacterium]